MSKTVCVIPSPDLPPDSYLPGVAAAGSELPEDEAQALIDAGLAVAHPHKKPEAPPSDTQE